MSRSSFLVLSLLVSPSFAQRTPEAETVAVREAGVPADRFVEEALQGRRLDADGTRETEVSAAEPLTLDHLLPDIAASADVRYFLSDDAQASLDAWQAGEGRAPIVDELLDDAAQALLDMAGVEPVSEIEPLYAQLYILDVLRCQVSPGAAVLSDLEHQLCPYGLPDAECATQAQAVLNASTLVRQAMREAGVDDLDGLVHGFPSACGAAATIAWVAHLESRLTTPLSQLAGQNVGGLNLLSNLLDYLGEDAESALLERMQSEGHLTPTRLAEFGSAALCQQPGIDAPTGPFGQCGLPGTFDGEDLPQAPPGIPGPDPSPIAMGMPALPPSGPVNGMEPMNGDTWMASEDCRHINPKFMLGTASDKPKPLSRQDEKKLDALADKLLKAVADAEKLAKGGAALSELVLASNKIAVAKAAFGAAMILGPSVGEAMHKALAANLARTDRAIQNADRHVFVRPSRTPDPTQDGDPNRCGADAITELLGCIFPQDGSPTDAPGGMVCESTGPLPDLGGAAPILLPTPDTAGGLSCSCGGIPTAADYADAPEYDAECIEDCPSASGDGIDLSCAEMCNLNNLDQLCGGDGPAPGNALADVCGAYDPSPVDDPEGAPEEGPGPCPPYDEECDQGMEPGPPPCAPGMPGCMP